MIEINGATGEGGGQVLRTSLALSIVTGRPFRIFNIRAGRKNPGLQPQHLASVKAAREICGGGVKGAERGSKEIVFGPGPVRAGSNTFDVGTAGSTTLVLQTVLYPLLTAAGESEVVITGGTHNVHAPPYDFLVRAFAPLLAEMGPALSVSIEAFGFYPVGGGRIRAAIKPAPWKRFTLEEFTPPTWWVNALVSRLSDQIAGREMKVVQQALDIPPPARRAA